jgi:hypothetical protein
MNLKCVNLNAFLENKLSQLDFIKMDIEGYEPVVLRNIKPILDKYKPLIYSEWWFHESKNNDLFDSIEFIGYEPFDPENLNMVKRENFYTLKIENLLLRPKTN